MLLFVLHLIKTRLDQRHIAYTQAVDYLKGICRFTYGMCKKIDADPELQIAGWTKGGGFASVDPIQNSALDGLRSIVPIDGEPGFYRANPRYRPSF